MNDEQIRKALALLFGLTEEHFMTIAEALNRLNNALMSWLENLDYLDYPSNKTKPRSPKVDQRNWKHEVRAYNTRHYFRRGIAG